MSPSLVELMICVCPVNCTCYFWVVTGRVSLAGTAALEEDAQILKVIEAYCTSAKTRQTLNSSKCRRSPLGLWWLVLLKITT